MRIKDIDVVVNEIRQHLPEYLEEHGREVGRNKNFRCPNNMVHKHEDKQPSANFVPNTNREIWNCFGCGERGDIFHAANFLEGLEIRGSGFVDTVVHLAEKFGVYYEEDEQAEEVIRANEYILSVTKKGQQAQEVQGYLRNRGFTGIAEEFGIGFSRYKPLYSIIAKSYDQSFIERNGLLKPGNLFDNRLVFPIHDDTGRVVGFAGRVLSGDKVKYLNSAGNKVFKKGEILYNLHRIKGDTVYVFEGYADVWTAWRHGIEAVAVCGTAFTEKHLSLLIQKKIKKAVFVFDGDEAGAKAKERTLPILENQMSLHCSYVTLSARSGEKDPDEFINKYGKDAFLQLEQTEIVEPRKKKKVQFLERIKEIENEILEGGFQGFKTGWESYDAKMEGVQKGLHLVGGISNIGKTAWMTELALRLATHNPNLYVIYFSIDDKLKLQYPRVLANLGGIPVNCAKNPNYYIEKMERTRAAKDDLWQKRAQAIAMLEKLAKRNLAIMDIDDASRLEDFEKEIQIFKEITGGDVAMFLDNFHKVRTQSFINFKERFTHVSEELKRITNQNDMVTFSTVELKKLGHQGRPDIEDIKESVDIIYDSESVHLLHNDFHSKQGNTKIMFESGGKPYPIVEVTVAKNKLSGWKGRLYYRFYSDVMRFDECWKQEQEKFRSMDVKKYASGGGGEDE